MTASGLWQRAKTVAPGWRRRRRTERCGPCLATVVVLLVSDQAWVIGVDPGAQAAIVIADSDESGEKCDFGFPKLVSGINELIGKKREVTLLRGEILLISSWQWGAPGKGGCASLWRGLCG